jgi:hypothetical protein
MNSNMEAGSKAKGSVNLPDGRSINVESLVYEDWASIRREALRQYKRNMISTWTDNADLLPDGIRDRKVEEAFKRVEEMTADALPKKQLTVEDLKSAGVDVDNSLDVEYSMWWMSKTPEGMMFTVWLSMRKSDPALTLAETSKLFMNESQNIDLATLTRAQDMVGDLSKPSLMGNSEAPPNGEGPNNKKRKRRQRQKRRAKEILGQK